MLPHIRLTAAAVLMSQLIAPPASANAPSAEPQAVIVSGVRHPELKTYRVMLAGLDAFDEYRALAPDAPEVRFKLRARNDDTAIDLHNLTLRIAGDHTSIPLPLAPDSTFSLPRSAEAEDEDADLLLNKPKGGYRWQADIRSAGVPAGMRRLGDLRLECKVLVAIGKKEMGFMLKAMVNSVLFTGDWCGHKQVNIATLSPRKIRTATLLHGDQRIALEIVRSGLGYMPPLPNPAYPDDTLIEIRFADEPDMQGVESAALP